jgi:hypothetical protein
MNNPVGCRLEDGILSIAFPDLEFRLHPAITAFNPDNSFVGGRLSGKRLRLFLPSAADRRLASFAIKITGFFHLHHLRP